MFKSEHLGLEESSSNYLMTSPPKRQKISEDSVLENMEKPITLNCITSTLNSTESLMALSYKEVILVTLVAREDTQSMEGLLLTKTSPGLTLVQACFLWQIAAGTQTHHSSLSHSRHALTLTVSMSSLDK
jgi:hypothetical protein